MQLSRVIDLYQFGTISIDEIGARSRALESEKETLQHTLDGMHEEDDERMTESEARAVLDEFDAIMEHGSLEDKQDVMRALIQRIVVLPEKGKLHIVWNF